MAGHTAAKTFYCGWLGPPALPGTCNRRGHSQAVVRLAEADHQRTRLKPVRPQGTLALRMGDIGLSEKKPDRLRRFTIKRPENRVRRRRGAVGRGAPRQKQKPCRKDR
jgi:hypothetical protein